MTSSDLEKLLKALETHTIADRQHQGVIEVRLEHLEKGLDRLLQILEGNGAAGLVSSQRVLESKLSAIEGNGTKKQWTAIAAVMTGLAGLLGAIAALLGFGKN